MQKLYSILCISVTLLCCLLLANCGHAPSLTRGPPLGPYKRARQTALSPVNGAGSAKSYVEQCKVYYRNATLDHFSWVRTIHPLLFLRTCMPLKGRLVNHLAGVAAGGRCVFPAALLPLR